MLLAAALTFRFNSSLPLQAQGESAPSLEIEQVSADQFPRMGTFYLLIACVITKPLIQFRQTERAASTDTRGQAEF